jgi:hypothetical protein
MMRSGLIRSELRTRSRIALVRLETLASMSDVDMPFQALHDQVNSAIDIIVQLQRTSYGARRVTTAETPLAANRSRRGSDKPRAWKEPSRGFCGTWTHSMIGSMQKGSCRRLAVSP